jgi:hypothetical protein
VYGINDPSHTCDEYYILFAKSGMTWWHRASLAAREQIGQAHYSARLACWSGARAPTGARLTASVCPWLASWHGRQRLHGELKVSMTAWTDSRRHRILAR